MTMQDPKQSIYAYRTKVAPNVSLPNTAKKPPAREQAMLELISDAARACKDSKAKCRAALHRHHAVAD